MPLMRIDMVRGRSQAEIQKILDIAYQTASTALHLRPRDRYQIVTQHDPEEMIIEDVSLGFKRTTAFLMFSLTSSPRKVENKQTFYKLLVKNLHDQLGIAPTDVMINITTNRYEDWSFVDGESQFLNGDLN